LAEPARTPITTARPARARILLGANIDVPPSLRAACAAVARKVVRVADGALMCR
jgi:hypothetical protein